MAKPVFLGEYSEEADQDKAKAFGRFDFERKKCTLCGKPVFRAAKFNQKVCAKCEANMPLEDFLSI